MNRFVLLSLSLSFVLFVSACGTLNSSEVDSLSKDKTPPPTCQDFKNHDCEGKEMEGRMTGGINILTDDDIKVTGGLTLHCDSDTNGLSNNLQINWQGNRWHLDKNNFEEILCVLRADPAPPVAPISVFHGHAMGTLNGVEGSEIEFTFQDKGEPGRNDTVEMVIRNADGEVVLNVPTTAMERGGNLQAHFDQPHKAKNK